MSGELVISLIDSEEEKDLGLEVTTADIGLTLTESHAGVKATGEINLDFGEYDSAGITLDGVFGSVYIGDDGAGVLAADLTDVLESNSAVFFTDDTAEVIDWGLPLGEGFNLEPVRGYQ